MLQSFEGRQSPEHKLDSICLRHRVPGTSEGIERINDPDDYAEARLLWLQIQGTRDAQARRNAEIRDKRLAAIRETAHARARERFSRMKESIRAALIEDPLRNRRALARSLGVSPTTAYKAIRQLVSEGRLSHPMHRASTLSHGRTLPRVRSNAPAAATTP